VLSLRSGGILAGLPIGADVCISAGLLDRAEGFLRIADDAAPSEVTPQLEAERARLGAKLAAARGSMDGVGEGFARAEAILREVEMRFALASALTEHGEWLMGEGRAADAQPLLEEAGSDLRAPSGDPLDRTRRPCPGRSGRRRGRLRLSSV